MHAEEARPTRATKQIRSRTEWGNATDEELIAGLLGKNDFAYASAQTIMDAFPSHMVATTTASDAELHARQVAAHRAM